MATEDSGFNISNCVPSTHAGSFFPVELCDLFPLTLYVAFRVFLFNPMVHVMFFVHKCTVKSRKTVLLSRFILN